MPDEARGRPTTVAEKHYKKLFNKALPEAIYGKAVRILRISESYLDGLGIVRAVRSNLVFYLAMYSTCVALQSAAPTPTAIAAFDTGLLSEALLCDAHQAVKSVFENLGADDRVAKGTEMVLRLKEQLKSKFFGS